MTPEQIAEVRPRLLEFASGRCSAGWRAADQRATGGLYLRGLMLDGRRKWMSPWLRALGWITSGCSSSSCLPWDYAAVRDEWRGAIGGIVRR